MREEDKMSNNLKLNECIICKVSNDERFVLIINHGTTPICINCFYGETEEPLDEESTGKSYDNTSR